MIGKFLRCSNTASEATTSTGLSSTSGKFSKSANIRPVCHPPYLKLINTTLNKKFDHLLPFDTEQWYWGSRGIAMERLHQKVSTLANGLSDKTILVIGCGTGRDILSWMDAKPRKIIGVDHFNYARAWNEIKKHNTQNIPLSSRLAPSKKILIAIVTKLPTD